MGSGSTVGYEDHQVEEVKPLEDGEQLLLSPRFWPMVPICGAVAKDSLGTQTPSSAVSLCCKSLGCCLGRVLAGQRGW